MAHTSGAATSSSIQSLQPTTTDGNQPSPSAAREEGTWLNIDGFHMGIGGDDSGARQCRRNSS